ncbi:MAG: hypothetical protein HYZ66_03545 [Chlamydiae bacterium]|nr:hypothetical protein [Chlamydiota bacterium]
MFYGAAEFSRDTDIAILAEPHNLERLSKALKELKAKCIAVPPFSSTYLRRGHAIHFRCFRADVLNMRIDVMSVMRRVAAFKDLWERRTTIQLNSSEKYELMSLPDLVQAKKTQRDKDWPMIRRLVEAHYITYQGKPTSEQISFWLREARTSRLLIELAGKYPFERTLLMKERPLLSFAKAKDEVILQNALEEEEKREREIDKMYWTPLKKELEELRRRRLKKANE